MSVMCEIMTYNSNYIFQRWQNTRVPPIWFTQDVYLKYGSKVLQNMWKESFLLGILMALFLKYPGSNVKLSVHEWLDLDSGKHN